ncbi:MAG: methyltransferase domain-containing protein [Candidatus Omnitrophica bacterium]|nr:methyltransferase domain-containing protein [Candidatus Omnitrophota bacterium]
MAGNTSGFFGREQAASYDTRWQKLAPMRAGLGFLTRLILEDLPADAKILCVGAGTGAELLDLASHFPGWSFTAADPSGPMLDVCREKAEQAGVTPRCTFHEGYVDSLPETREFDAATAILVSQFITNKEKRSDFFRGIARRLRPGGRLITADLSAPDDPQRFQSLMAFWEASQILAGSAPADAARTAEMWKDKVAVLTTAGGFETPVRFYQTLFIHAWHAQVPEED